MELDLRTKMAENTRLFSPENGPIDVILVAQAYTTLFKLNQSTANTYLLPVYSSPSAGFHQKLAFVRAVTSLVSRPESPETDLDLMVFAAPLRAIFSVSAIYIGAEPHMLMFI